MTPSPFLDGEQVTLHSLEEADLAFCRDVVNRPAVGHNLLLTTPVTLDHEEEWQSRLRLIRFGPATFYARNRGHGVP